MTPPHDTRSSDDLTERYTRERALSLIGDELTRVSDTPKLFRQALAAVVDLLGADGGVIAFAEHPDAPLVRAATAGRGLPLDDALLQSFVSQQRPVVPPTTILAPLMRGGRAIGVLGLARETPFPPGDGRFLARVTRLVSRELERREEQRVIAVLERITAKIVQELRPNDLFYQILHGLRDLLRYDHSSALFLYDADVSRLTLRAEQIAYVKGKSAEIGRVVAVDAAAAAHFARDGVHVVARPSVVWEGAEPWRTLAAQLAAGGGAPPERALLLAPLVYRGAPLGLLKAAATSAHAFGERAARRVERLAPFAAAALAHAQAALRFEARLVETEKRAAMSDLARGIAHDVNNALGVVLPLAEQLQVEAEGGSLDAGRASEDLAEVARAARLAKRIMGGMLHFARGGTAKRTRVDLATAVQAASALLGPRLAARGATLVKEIDQAASAVYADQSQLERILLNLLLNAADATPPGRPITLRTMAAPATDGAPRVLLIVEDEGPGMPPDILAHVEEPFFTTKPGGTGLGLAICRALVWENDGRLTIESAPGKGTRVRVTLPAAAPATALAPPTSARRAPAEEATRGA